jgi:transcriptional regulator with XRE-family HTH domain
MSELANILANEFKDKEYAHAYMESNCVNVIASQIYVLRKFRGLSQEELSKLSGIAQERISKIEQGDFDSLTMKTLNKLSKAFDVNLSIKFESFADGIESIISLNEDKLKVETRIASLSNMAKKLNNSTTSKDKMLKPKLTIIAPGFYNRNIVADSVTTVTNNYGLAEERMVA